MSAYIHLRFSRYLGAAACALLGACGQSSGPGSPQYAPNAQPAEIVVQCGRLIDGLSDEPRLNQSIQIRGERIVRIEAQNTAPPLTNQTVIHDLTEFTCLPGLINTHVHFDGNPEDSVDYSVYARRTPDETLQLILDNARTTLLTGFTTVRHVGAWFPDAVYRARELIKAGQAPGPRIQTAGPYLTIPGGGGDLTFPEIPVEDIPAESQQGIASTPEEFAARQSGSTRLSSSRFPRAHPLKPLLSPAYRGDLALYLRWGNVVEDKVDASFAALIHHAVLFLVVDLIDVANGHLLWPAVDHEAHPRVSVNRYVDAVTKVE